MTLNGTVTDEAMTSRSTLPSDYVYAKIPKDEIKAANQHRFEITSSSALAERRREVELERLNKAQEDKQAEEQKQEEKRTASAEMDMQGSLDLTSLRTMCNGDARDLVDSMTVARLKGVLRNIDLEEFGKLAACVRVPNGSTLKITLRLKVKQQLNLQAVPAAVAAAATAAVPAGPPAAPADATADATADAPADDMAID